jgi:ribosomal protein L7Ae-like RNA K-turn-binding protein
MNSNQKIADLLTICIKAGKTVRGFDSVCDALKSGNVYCVMTASDVSAKTFKEVEFVCHKYNTPHIESGLSKEETGRFTGKQTGVIAVCDKGFAERFIQLCKNSPE